MNVEQVFDLLSCELPQAGVDFLMVGGHAVNHYGYTRATMDVDFMIAAEAVAAVREMMKKAGFSNVSEGENVIFFSRPDSPLRVDFLPVDSKTMRELLAGAVEIDYGGVSVRVPALRDLIAMKLFALKGGGARREERDFADIAHLMLLHGLDPEADLKPLCDRFSTDEIYRNLTVRIEEESHA